MLKSKLVKSICFTGLLSLSVLPISSVMAMEEEPIYGSQLMTQEERQNHQRNMQAAKTPEAKEQLRQQHHEQMQIRAKEKGVTLPDNPPENRGHINQQDRPGSGGGNRY